MGKTQFICFVCESEFTIEEYGNNNCPGCGQKFVYDEGQSVSLSNEQIKLLKKHAKDETKRADENCWSCKYGIKTQYCLRHAPTIGPNGVEFPFVNDPIWCGDYEPCGKESRKITREDAENLF